MTCAWSPPPASTWTRRCALAVPGRPAAVPARRPPEPAAIARTSGRHPAAGGILRRCLCPAPGPAGAGHRRGDPADPRELSLARQHPRTGKRRPLRPAGQRQGRNPAAASEFWRATPDPSLAGLRRLLGQVGAPSLEQIQALPCNWPPSRQAATRRREGGAWDWRRTEGILRRTCGKSAAPKTPIRPKDWLPGPRSCLY